MDHAYRIKIHYKPICTAQNFLPVLSIFRVLTLSGEIMAPGNITTWYQVIPSHGNPWVRRTLFDGYLLKYCSVKYQTFHRVSEKTSQQTCLHQKAPRAPKGHKHQLTCQIELTSGSLLILVIPKNRRGKVGYYNITTYACSRMDWQHC